MSDKLSIVRKLLAQAEGTSNEAEAAIFLAKAQAMMTQYGIDEAEARRSGVDRASTIDREWVDLPGRQQLVKAKRSLLAVAAEANSCMALQHTVGREKRMSITGYSGDRERTILLFNSLLIQLERAIRAEGKTDVVYRNNFAWGYVARIAARLQQAKAEAAALAGQTAALALRDTSAEVQASVGKVRAAPRGKARKYDPEARVAGDRAGRQAVLENRLEGSAARGAIG